MESARGQEFKVGLLMLAGIAAIITIVIWTDPISFASYYQVTAYLDNAGGLRNGSPVTLAGIRVGEVVGIATNADGRGTIRCTLNLNTSYPIDQSSELRLLTSGIFGDSYLEFGPPDADQRGTLLSQDGTAAVRVAPGLIDEVSARGQEIIGGMAELLGEENRRHVNQLITNLSQSSARLDGLLARLDDAAAKGSRTLEDSDLLVGELRETVAELRGRLGTSMDGVDTMVATVNREVPAFADAARGVANQGRTSLGRIDQLVARADGSLERMDPVIEEALVSLRQALVELRGLTEGIRAGRGVIGQLIANQLLAEDISDTVVNAKVASERIADHPEILIWGQTQEEQAAQAQRRRLMQARRAFAAGQRGRAAFQPDAVDIEPIDDDEPEPAVD